MSTRTITVERYMLPGSAEALDVDVLFYLVDADHKKIDGYRQDDDTGIIGITTLNVEDSAATIDLTPTDEIYPASYWETIVRYDGRCVRRAMVQMAAGGAMTYPEFLALDSSVDYWDIYENRLLPDPTAQTENSRVAVQDVGGILQWVVVAAPTGTGSVTSVAVSGTDGLEVDSGSPITTAGTIQLGVNAANMRTHLGIEVNEYVTAPVTPTSSGTKGQRAWDGTFMYECVATDTWVRWIPMRTW